MNSIIQKSIPVIVNTFIVALGITALISFALLFVHLLTYGI